MTTVGNAIDRGGSGRDRTERDRTGRDGAGRQRNWARLGAIVAAFAIAGCGASDADDAASSAEGATTTEATTTTEVTTTSEATTTTEEATTTTEDATTTTEAAEPVEMSEDEAAAAEAWATVFDSTIGYDDKAAFLDDAEALQATVESYTTAGDAMGGISLEPTTVVVDGEVATVTYDVYFGESAAYTDLSGEIALVDGTWTVSRDEFCSFMASARNSCPS